MSGFLGHKKLQLDECQVHARSTSCTLLSSDCMRPTCMQLPRPSGASASGGRSCVFEIVRACIWPYKTGTGARPSRTRA